MKLQVVDLEGGGWGRNCPKMRRFQEVKYLTLPTNQAYSASTPPLPFTTRLVSVLVSGPSLRTEGAGTHPHWEVPDNRSRTPNVLMPNGSVTAVSTDATRPLGLAQNFVVATDAKAGTGT